VQTSPTDLGAECDVVVSMLPNDQIVTKISEDLLQKAKPGSIHISCSTISPATSSNLEKLFKSKGCIFVAAPVFARPDGISKRQATWLLSGDEKGRTVASDLLKPLGNVVDYGKDVGAANVVKLCGNFMIAVGFRTLNVYHNMIIANF
jgi:3-hydroxyisobutyrate dehydrogenase-like beta-hydroxyacid dehydrogenase